MVVAPDSYAAAQRMPPHTALSIGPLWRPFAPNGNKICMLPKPSGPRCRVSFLRKAGEKNA